MMSSAEKLLSGNMETGQPLPQSSEKERAVSEALYLSSMTSQQFCRALETLTS